MRTAKIKIQPNLKKLVTTQRFSAVLVNGNKLKRAQLKLIFDYDINRCIDVTNVSVSPEARSFVNYELQAYPSKTELLLHINDVAENAEQTILYFDIVPMQTCSLKIKTETISAEGVSSNIRRISGTKLSISVEGQPTFSDTVTVTTTPTSYGIEFAKKPSPTPLPPKNWNGFITANIIMLSLISYLIWLAFKIKNSLHNNRDENLSK